MSFKNHMGLKIKIITRYRDTNTAQKNEVFHWGFLQ